MPDEVGPGEGEEQLEGAVRGGEGGGDRAPEGAEDDGDGVLEQGADLPAGHQPGVIRNII